MKLFDRLMDLNPDAMTPDNPHYQRYDYNAGLVKIGWAMLAAGLLMDSIGLKVGADVAIAGAGLQFVGGAVVATEVPHLDLPRS